MKNVQMITFPVSGFPSVRLMGYANQGWTLETLSRVGALKTRELAADPRVSFVWSWSHLAERVANHHTPSSDRLQEVLQQPLRGLFPTQPSYMSRVSIAGST
ncbi:MAG: hypothetical protein IT193_19720 [Propionibacteriaceae bacterium]|nr:hypothetical protein [Propionibacteriaceae bacterium]